MVLGKNILKDFWGGGKLRKDGEILNWVKNFMFLWNVKWNMGMLKYFLDFLKWEM